MAMTTWKKIASYCEDTYGVHVDWDEKFFECPECGEPIYQNDWYNSEFVNENEEWICPICENLLREVE